MRYRVEMSAEVKYRFEIDADSAEKAEEAAMERSSLLMAGYDHLGWGCDAWLVSDQWVTDSVAPIG